MSWVHPRVKPELIRKIRRMDRDGMSYPQIGREVDLSAGRVQEIMRPYRLRAAIMRKEAATGVKEVIYRFDKCATEEEFFAPLDDGSIMTTAHKPKPGAEKRKAKMIAIFGYDPNDRA